MHDERLTDEKHPPMFSGILKDWKLSLGLDKGVAWHIADGRSGLNAVACEALLLRVVLGRGHVELVFRA